MLHVITGGSGSGKSAYAEAEAVRLSKAGNRNLKKYYIATMEPFGEETLRKIHRHREMRAGKGFKTVECYVDLAGKAAQLAGEVSGEGVVLESKDDRNERKSVILLECMSNLVANELYRPDGAGKRTAERILWGVKSLCEFCGNVVIVTNEVCSECTVDSVEMQEYKRVLSEINCSLARMADAVTEVVYGIPVEVKR